jgi:hypothetical protein
MTQLRAVNNNENPHPRDLARAAVKAHKTRHIDRTADETLGAALSAEDEKRRALYFTRHAVRFHKVSLWRRVIRALSLGK